MLILAVMLFSCSKEYSIEVQEGKASSALYLSEIRVNGQLTKQHVYENGKPVKTRFYYGTYVSELTYTYNPASRSVVFNQSGYVNTFYYDLKDRPIRQDNYGVIVIDYTYEKDKMVRLASTTYNSPGVVRSLDDYKFIYSGNWLSRIENQYNRYIPTPGSNLTVYECKWANPFSYNYYDVTSPETVHSYTYSNTIKSPEYNFNITPTGLSNTQNMSNADITRRSGILFTSPAHGMLLLKQNANGTTILVENVITNSANLPVSYDQTLTINGVTTRSRYEYTYVRL